MLPMGLLLQSERRRLRLRAQWYHEQHTVAMALAEATHHSAPRSEWRKPNEALQGQKTTGAGGKRPSVLKEIEPQGEVARVRLTEVSGLLRPRYVRQLHGDEEDAEFINSLS